MKEGSFMKKVLIVALVTLMGLVSTVNRSVAAGLLTVDGPKLQTMMADGKPMVIVDVREPELFAKGHIKKAINIPYDGAKPRVLKELSSKDRIMFVCHGGPMGDELGKLLVQSGYKDVYNLAGGMREWRGEVVK
jgi:rhodanese-related sulfurtransferase